MAFDLQRARQDTPGSAHVLHFNNAGASLMPTPVLEAVITHLRLEAHIGGYEAANVAHSSIEHTYDAIATLINCSRDEIAISENATRAWDQAFYSIPFQPGDRILTAASEFPSNYIAFLQIAKRTGAIVEVIPNDAHGQISLEALRNAINERVKLIAITHVPTNGGLVNPIAEVGKIAREHNILYLVDACQSVGQMPIDVQHIGCDLLSATGRKYLRGPRGTGFLYIRQSILDQLEPPFLELLSAELLSADRYAIRADARRFETWETNYATKIGLGIAVDYALHWGLDTIWRRIKSLAYTLRTQLSPLPGVIVHDRGVTQCGIVTFTIEDKASEDIVQALKNLHINITSTSPIAALLNKDSRNLPSMVRASVHYYNTEEEIARFCQVVETLL